MRLWTKGERKERDGIRFLCRPAVSFDLSLIIVISIELIAILAVLLTQHSVVRSVLLFQPSTPPSFSLAHKCFSDNLSLNRAIRGSVTWDHVPRLSRVKILIAQKTLFEEEDRSMAFRLSIARSYKQFFIILNNHKTLVCIINKYSCLYHYFILNLIF